MEELERELHNLEVNADAHKEPEASRKMVNKYAESLAFVSARLDGVLVSSTGEGENADAQLRSLLRAWIPKLLMGVVAHLGRHYWTGADSRKGAQDLLRQILRICHAKTVPELLVGLSKEPRPSITSPYMPLSSNELAVSALLDSGEGDWEGAESDGVENLALADCSDLESGNDVPKEATKMDVGPIFPAGMVGVVLGVVKQRLHRKSWKSHPNAKHTLLWCLGHLKHPQLSPHLETFFPPLLMLLDDHETYHKVLGLKAMAHLISNIDAAELRRYGRADVIYEALKPMLYSNEVELVAPLHVCFLLLLPVVDGPRPVVVDQPRMPGKSSEVFGILLNSMDFESKVAMRKALSSVVARYVDLLGIFIVRHLKRLLTVLAAYLEFPDYCGEQTRKNTLRSLAVLLRTAWLRIPRHSHFILKALMKLISDLCPDTNIIPEKEEIQSQFPLISECLVLLARCSPNLKTTYEDLLKSTDNAGLSTLLTDTLAQLNTPS